MNMNINPNMKKMVTCLQSRGDWAQVTFFFVKEECPRCGGTDFSYDEWEWDVGGFCISEKKSCKTCQWHAMSTPDGCSTG